MTPAAAFDAKTLETLLESLARFTSGGPGVTRFTYDDAWCDAHRWLVNEARSRGLAATPDAAGNLLLHDLALKPGDLSRPVLMVGSHLDSVRHGGKYDGAYGTIAGLMIAAQHRGRAGLPVVGFVTCEEEQSRFDAPMMGARSLLGQIEMGELDRVRDGDGVTWREALTAARAKGCAAPLAEGAKPIPPLFRAAVEIELHIEQGPTLEAERTPLGIVEHIAGYRRLAIAVTGAPRHSGTTPKPLRRDALVAAAEIILEIERLTDEFGDASRTTVGNARVAPGLFNVVPGACELWAEVRHVETAELERMKREVIARCEAIAKRRKVEVAVEDRTRQEPTPLSKPLADRAEALARELGVKHRRMPSGAAHDSMEFARAGAQSLMLFVPSHDGISHSPDEFTSTEELWTGVSFASALIERLAAEHK